MAITFATPLAEARVLLNDPTGAIYQDAPMITLGNKVYKELQTKMSAEGLSTTKEVSADVAVLAGVVFLGDGAGLPTDLIQPTYIYERAKDSEDDWIPMDEQDFEPDNLTPDGYLRVWAWREDEIKFPASSANREVRIKYKKSVGSITATTSPVTILNCQNWLSQRLAAVAALVLGSNPSRAEILQSDLQTLWSDFMAIQKKTQQRRPFRRRRTHYRRN